MNATEQYQRNFAAHLRNPELNPPPQGVNAERAGVYVELLFNNVEDFLSSCFPVVRSILDDTQWNGLVRQFYAEHACTTPYFREISAEFVEWLTSASLSDRSSAFAERSRSVPFLLELAHYEWVEIPLTLDNSVIDWSTIDPEGDLLEGIPALNPVMVLQSYQYPVHRISAENQPTEPEPTHLIVLRDQQNTIQFVTLNPATARLVQLLQENLSAREAIFQLAEEMQHPEPEQLLAFGQQILAQLKTQDVVLGMARD
ncbi:putative DNA-binding domain-containing protein [Thiothrix lacustris]|uniref:DNA-binding domain-containing protein n=1 Tax=Thiothrix lacustris TaxID=525917 RepID=A0ABY9MKX4_9GAMM|nr:putative DNA-binding domain-containing protein [Thiothrix lacustris]WML89334.1 putative DNA-binding domain-containing protein [Thiothrix lacustris]